MHELFKNLLPIGDTEKMSTVSCILSAEAWCKLRCFIEVGEKPSQLVLHSFRISYDDDMGYFSLRMLKKIINMPVEFFLCNFKGAVSSYLIQGELFYYRTPDGMGRLSSGTRSMSDKPSGKRISRTAQCRADVDIVTFCYGKLSGLLKPSECKRKRAGNSNEEDIGTHRVFTAKNGKL